MIREKVMVLERYPHATSRKTKTPDGHGYRIVDRTTGLSLSDVTYTRDMAWKHAADRIRRAM